MTGSRSSGIGRRPFIGGAVAAATFAKGAFGTSAAFSQEAKGPQHGGTLKILLRQDPPAVISAGNASGPSKLVSGKIIEGLLTYDFSLNPQPHLATAWQVSPDKREFTFTLRQGVRWHDGRDFTSEDVAFSIRLAAEIHPTGRGNFRNLTEIRTPDPHTVTIVLSEASPALLTAFSGTETAIIPKHLYDGTDYFNNPVNARPIGTGPFLFKEWVHGSFIRLERNPAYWDHPKPYLDGIIVRIVPDMAAIAIALETGEGDIGYNTPIPLADLDRFKTFPQIGIETRGYEAAGDWTTLIFNLDNRYLKQLPVRQAIAHAIDREAVLRLGWNGYGTIATTPITKSLGRYAARDVPVYPFDPAASERLLDEAGLPRAGNGVRFGLTLDPLPSTESFRNVAAYLRQALGKVGIAVTVRAQEFGTYVKRVYTDRDFDFAYAWLINGTDPSRLQTYYSSKNFKPGVPFSNGAHYQNGEVDRLLDAGALEVDDARRIEIYAEVQRILARELPGLDLVAQQVFTVYNKRVHDHTVNADGLQSTLANTFIKA
ncbi:ABC transporter substrate-binding protein [Bradyrhizobium sp. SSUT112]|uniref:ABC transporter substrate-binding protein n=1 Tax=Bradyrhizobium sp. SSUT112 TaxID=3040604 RepID=UPI00244AA08B|nr:ABC transporter substrate-binding protein [Bradyrhizobium sp. SSUT112]MDH2350330.1 ABC transporter substrate-binding protein [Bradyrhizobium sp. SSUT112]